MSDISEAKAQLEQLFASQRLAVLGTHNNGQPYGSLVAFAATDDLRDILFATTRSTRKYANLSADSRVSMLIDSRSNEDIDFHAGIAATAAGRAEEVSKDEGDPFLDIFLEKHPYLREFVLSPTCALLRVRVDTYYVVSRFQNVVEIHINR